MDLVKLLDLARERANLPSDYALAAAIGITRQRVSQMRSRRDNPGDGVVIRLAELAELDPGYALACMHAVRAKRTPERKAWESLARKAGMAAMLLIGLAIGLSAGGLLGSDPAELFAYTGYSLYEMGFTGCAWLALLAALLLAKALGPLSPAERS